MSAHQPRWAELALSQTSTSSGCLEEGRLGRGVSRTVPKSEEPCTWEQTTPSLRDSGEHPQVCLERQVGQSSAAVGWGAVGLTCRLCHTVLRRPGLALTE